MAQKPKNPPSTNVWVGNLPPTIDKEELVTVFSRFGDIANARVFPPKGNIPYASGMMRTTSQEVATFIVEQLDGTEVDGLESAIVCNYAPHKDGKGDGKHAPQSDRWSGGGALGPAGDAGKGKGKGKGDAGKGKGKNKGKGKDKDWGDHDKGGWNDAGKGSRDGAGKGGRGARGKGAGGVRHPLVRMRARPVKGPDGKNPPSTNIWIGSLPVDFDRDALHALFGGYGEIVSARVFPPKNDSSNASAMVRLKTQEQATYIVEELDGQMIPGLEHPISCNYASPGKDKGQHPERAGGMIKAGGGTRRRDESEEPGDYESYGKIGGGAASGGGWLRPKTDGSSRAHPYGGKGASKPQGKHAATGPIGAIGAIGAIPAIGAASSAGTMIKADSEAGFQDSGGRHAKPQAGPPLSRDKLVAAAHADRLLGGTETAPEAKLYVKGLPSDMDDLGLYRLFSPFGAILPGRVKAMVWPDGQCKGYGFVDFAYPGDAEQAKAALNGFQRLLVLQATGQKRDAPMEDGIGAAAEAERFTHDEDDIYEDDVLADSGDGWV